MKKVKFFMSILKERDWLEKMEREGWLLTDMTFGMIYHFKRSEPSEKVFEIERFGVSKHPSIQELNARRFAIDVAVQSGWEVVTHDEEMNYYFMKDKAGDETDEFYDDAESRREHVERFRKRYCKELPWELLRDWMIVTAMYMLAALIVTWKQDTVEVGFMWMYLMGSFMIGLCILYANKMGHGICRELSMSREEWENRKRHSEKRKFTKAQQLYSFLQEQGGKGLALVGYDNGKYLFEKDHNRYDYYVDTKSDLKKRMKNQGSNFKDEKKDWYLRSPKWYEMSMAEAEQYGLKAVCVIKSDFIIYKRAYSGEKLPKENGKLSIRIVNPLFKVSGGLMLLMLAAGILGFAIGYFSC